MFDSGEPRSNPVASFIAQLVFVPIAVGCFSVPAFSLYGLLEKMRLLGDPHGWEAIGVFLLFVIGLVFGRFAARRWPGLAPIGFWIWILPTCVLAAAFVRDWLNPLQRQEIFSMYFQPRGSHEGLTRFLLTDPSLSSIGYSIGLYCGASKTKAPGGDSPPPVLSAPEHVPPQR
jgi:hypothetical protein